jgi:hypothetical protein
MSGEGEADISTLSTSSSDTLSVEELPGLDSDAHTITGESTFSTSTSSTNVSYWVPGGFPGKVLQALGPGTMDVVARFAIKKRLASISSDIDLRLRKKEIPAEGDIDIFNVEAYRRDLVELSS